MAEVAQTNGTEVNATTDTPRTRGQAFIDALSALDDEKTPDRAALAHLRRALSGEPRDVVRARRIALPFAPKSERLERAYVEAAALFGLHPTSPSRMGAALALGTAFAKAHHNAQMRTGEGNKTTSVEARFMALLQCHREELPVHLRHAVSLFKSHDPALFLKWTDVLDALCSWNSPTQYVQHRWAREFWGAPAFDQPIKKEDNP